MLGHLGEVTIAEIDLRVGGRWRYVMVADGGFEVAFHGEYREIVPHERIVSTEVYPGYPNEEAVNTATFEEVDGRTTLTILVEHTSKEARDATSTPAWRPACRTQSISWSRWRSRFAEQASPGRWD